MLKKRDTTSFLPSKPFFKTWAYILNLVCLIIIWLVFALFLTRLPPQLPLWYSLPPGTSQLGNRQDLIFIPILATSSLLISSILLLIHKSSVAIYTYLVLWITLLVQLLFLISLINIINLAL
jgi:hypothetical protein